LDVRTQGLSVLLLFVFLVSISAKDANSQLTVLLLYLVLVSMLVE